VSHRHKSHVSRILVVLAGLGALLLSLEFWSLDICADAGGQYKAFTFTCSGVDQEFKQVWSRPWISWLLILLLPVYVVACAAITVKVYASDAYSPSQKVAQAALLWLLPVIGPAAVGWFTKHGAAPVSRPPRDPYPREPEWPG
jgi:hypothetical protein